MKKFLLSIGLAVLAVSTMAQVPTYVPQTLVNDVAIAAQTATNLNAVIFCGKQASVGVAISQSNTVDQSTSGAVNGFFFQRSVDGTIYDTNGVYITVVPVGKNWQTTFTNIPTWGCGYIKLFWATNAAASGGNNTNVGSLHIAYGVKISAP